MTSHETRVRDNVAWLAIFIVNAGFVLWGVMATAFPNYLLGPGGVPIVKAGYQGYTNASWSSLVAGSPMTAGYIEVLFRTYGMYNVAVGFFGAAIAVTAFRRGERWAWWALLVGNTIALVSAMTYDRMVNAIGPFELSEYLGLVLIFAALALNQPFRAHRIAPGAVFGAVDGRVI